MNVLSRLTCALGQCANFLSNDGEATAVITGASTGLGLAMAKEFAASGASVALLARKQDALAAAKAEVQKAAGKANIKIEAYSCDVAKAAPIADSEMTAMSNFVMPPKVAILQRSLIMPLFK